MTAGSILSMIGVVFSSAGEMLGPLFYREGPGMLPNFMSKNPFYSKKKEA